MDPIAFLDRKIELKQQALKLIVDEIRDLKDRRALLRLKGRLESMIPDGEPLLSQKIDCINFLLEN